MTSRARKPIFFSWKRMRGGVISGKVYFGCTVFGRMQKLLSQWTKCVENKYDRVKNDTSVYRRKLYCIVSKQYISDTFLPPYVRCISVLECCSSSVCAVPGSIPAGVSGFFIDIKSFWSHCGPGVDSASNRHEYQEYFLRVKAAGA